MSDLKVAVFAYNFPHKKTQDFLLRLFCEGYKVAHVLAADPVPLSIPPSSIRTKIRHGALIHPRDVAASIGAPYSVVAHNDASAIEIVNSHEINLGIIAGARILKAPIIEAFKYGVINYHPGLIPQARGLDAMLWSIYYDIPLGVTAHLIDERVDAGKILFDEKIELHTDDTIFDLSERLYETQLEMIKPSIEAALSKSGSLLEAGTKLRTKMPAEQERDVLEKLPSYLERYATA